MITKATDYTVAFVLLGSLVGSRLPLLIRTLVGALGAARFRMKPLIGSLLDEEPSAFIVRARRGYGEPIRAAGSPSEVEE
jgi:hypothetical protein